MLFCECHACVDVIFPADDAERSAYFGLFNGGTAGVIWMMIITWFFVLAMIASFAEMASMVRFPDVRTACETYTDFLRHYLGSNSRR